MQPQLDAILTELRQSRGIDLSGYRRSMLERRLAARMARLRCDCPAEYLNRLQDDPHECDHLVNAIAINVSSFFRNPIVWEILAQAILPDIVEQKRRTSNNEIRVWSAGCAAGEEAYSLAILVHQALKGNVTDWRVNVFGTDIDQNALAKASDGVFPRASFESTKLGFIDEYFKVRGSAFQIRPFIRKMISFSYDDLTSHQGLAPKDSIFGSFDLVFCRNVLIYFGNDLQNRVSKKLAKSLDTGGCLVLGESESLSHELQSSLIPVDGRNRIYLKRG